MMQVLKYCNKTHNLKTNNKNTNYQKIINSNYKVNNNQLIIPLKILNKNKMLKIHQNK